MPAAGGAPLLGRCSKGWEWVRADLALQLLMDLVGLWKHPMLTDVAILLGLGFAAGYGLRAWISTRRRRAIRKARGD